MAKKKKTEGEVVAFPITEENIDPREQMTPEEIEEFMRKEEEEMERRLSKFIQANPKPDTSSITEEEDEDEEEFTIDLSQGMITQKIGEGILFAGDPSTLVEKVGHEPISVMTEVPAMSASQDPYAAIIRDVLVRKAIAKEIKAIREERDALEDKAEAAPSYLAKAMQDAISEMDKKRTELTKVIRGNKVHYEEIPDWIDYKIKENVEETILNLISFLDEWQGE